MRKRAQESELPVGASLAILRVLADNGPTSLSELPSHVHARPREVVSTVEDLERAGLVQVAVQGVEEIAELTEAGRKMISS
jgi:predicted transcriptional regulator